MSKRQTILNHVRDVILPGITTAGGYNFTVAADSCQRGIREIDAQPDSAFPIIYIARTTEERSNLTGNQFMAVMEVVLVGYVKNSTGIDGAQEDLDDLIEDITKVIETDRTLGLSEVKWCEIRKIVTDDGDLQMLAGCAITVQIQYVSEGVTP
jgi:hypothetical protein